MLHKYINDFFSHKKLIIILVLLLSLFYRKWQEEIHQDHEPLGTALQHCVIEEWVCLLTQELELHKIFPEENVSRDQAMRAGHLHLYSLSHFNNLKKHEKNLHFKQMN